MIHPSGSLDLAAIRAAASGDHSDPGALERAETVLARASLQVGDYYWHGPDCLRVVAIVSGSHQSELVLMAERTISPIDGTDDWSWPCPGCGCAMGFGGESIPLRLDPRCGDCAIPVTLRDPSLPPAAPGIRDGSAGGEPTTEEHTR